MWQLKPPGALSHLFGDVGDTVFGGQQLAAVAAQISQDAYFLQLFKAVGLLAFCRLHGLCNGRACLLLLDLGLGLLSGGLGWCLASALCGLGFHGFLHG